jgi:hypothetical protein
LLLTKFLDAISKFLPGDPFIGGSPPDIAKLNPDKIYVENVRAAMRVSFTRAELYCETAVRQGIFDRWVEAYAPDDVVAIVARTVEEAPKTIHRWVERHGKLQEETLQTAGLVWRTFYRLHR